MKFLVKLEKNTSHIFEWYKRFSVGREGIEDDQRPGRPVSVCSQQTMYKINEIAQ